MMRNPVFVEADDSIEKVSQVMLKHAIGRVPVVDNKKNMACIGYVTSTDVVHATKK